jgi:predicted 3-demethylubiquinone-9 3-methyltransferase (glyoxalase superfamily)
MMPIARPFLLFEGQAEAAMNFWISIFPGATINSIQRYGAGGTGKEGAVMKATVAGQTVMCTDSVVHHAFTFTPSFSFFVTCESEEEMQRLFAALREGGSELMPLNNYGFSRLFTWANDRYGVSWQLNLE